MEALNPVVFQRWMVLSKAALPKVHRHEFGAPSKHVAVELEKPLERTDKAYRRHFPLHGNNATNFVPKYRHEILRNVLRML